MLHCVKENQFQSAHHSMYFSSISLYSDLSVTVFVSFKHLLGSSKVRNLKIDKNIRGDRLTVNVYASSLQ